MAADARCILNLSRIRDRSAIGDNVGRHRYGPCRRVRKNRMSDDDF